MNEHNPRAEWSSWINFILAATGAAVGLGNIWKFPYMVGGNGGSAFVLLYLFFIAIIGIPIMLAEMMIGKCGRQNPVNTMLQLARDAGASRHWQMPGWLGLFTLLLTLSFYSVVASWSLAYLCKTMMGVFHHVDKEQVLHIWQVFLASPWRLLFWDTVFMVMTMMVVAFELEVGIERASKLMMPALFLVLFLLVIYASTTSGFKQSLSYLLSFDLSKITGPVAISALGHAFFSLAIGAGCMLVYGSYLPKHIHLGGAVLTVALLDVLVAFFSGIAIFSVVFANHLSPEGGPGLMFQILPIAFGSMDGGMYLGGLFFLLLLFAAWSSSISMAEPLVILLVERYGFKRLPAAVIIGAIAWLLSIGSLLSFNLWADYKLFSHWNFFFVITDLVTNILLPLGGLGFALFAGWCMKRAVAENGLSFPLPGLFVAWRFSIRYIAPIGILVIILSSILF